LVSDTFGLDILEIWRWAGASFARYRLPQHFDQDTFDAYVEDLDEQFLLSSADILADFYEELEKVNSPEVIEVISVMSSSSLSTDDKGRQSYRNWDT
jgi:hypothetical protein